MDITPKTKVSAILDKYPFLLDFLAGLAPKFKLLKNPIARKTVGKVASLDQAASIGGLGIEELLSKIAGKIEEETGEHISWTTSKDPVEDIKDPQARHEILKEIIRDLHDGADMADVKKRFHELIKDIDASEISKMEQKLIEEGMPESEVKRLCDVHVQVFKESLEHKEPPQVPAGHPVHTFMLENGASEEIMNKLEAICNQLGDKPDAEAFGKARKELEEKLTDLQKIDIHYLRKENQLFPLLEKHDISGPSQVMWALHDDIRAMLKKTKGEFDTGNPKGFIKAANESIQTIRDMIYKEEHILYPVSMDTLSKEEWNKVRHGESEIGYAWIEPPAENQEDQEIIDKEREAAGRIELDTGNMTPEQVNLLLKHLPVDISFVDEKDEVLYYSATKERLFPRSPAVIGRKVQKCHPPKSMHMVQQILDDFRGGKKDVAEFWIQMKGKFIHIRYFAIRNDQGQYKGCLEVSQDVTAIRGLEGEKRLLG
ncbi:DUF438 domain-containing protein [Fibrobacterota bacterium]